MYDEAKITRVYRDNWSGDFRPYTNLLITADRPDQPEQVTPLEPLFAAAGVEDGDEIEIIVRKTGRRPFGERRVILQAANTYAPETDEQLAHRLATGEVWDHRLGWVQPRR